VSYVIKQYQDTDMASFKEKFFNAIDEAKVPREEAESEFKDDDFRWAETQRGVDSPTGKTRILINHKAFGKNPDTGPDYETEMLIGEGLHLIKEIDPSRAERLYQAAVNDPRVLGWLEESYVKATNKGEKRPFDKWVKNSRLDQIVGGYILGGKSSSVPTMQAWPTERLPYGESFKNEIEALKKDLGL
jgi:hypothetical protein|tara:strand:- start:1640 stop:2203 length:564 start_codon:yes stop_codon:yes gene_type:complete